MLRMSYLRRMNHTHTVAEFLQSKTLPTGAIVIVDEAGQIGGKEFHELLKCVEACRGRLILSGCGE